VGFLSKGFCSARGGDSRDGKGSGGTKLRESEREEGGFEAGNALDLEERWGNVLTRTLLGRLRSRNLSRCKVGKKR